MHHDQPPHDTAPQTGDLPSAADIVNDLQQRCDKLRQWHVAAEADLSSRQEQLRQRVEEADRQAAAAEARDRALDERNQALDLREAQLAERGIQLDSRQHDLDTRDQRIARLESELRDQQDQLKRTGAEFDEEWTSLQRLRRAHETLAEALESERERVGRQTLHLADTDQRQAA